MANHYTPTPEQIATYEKWVAERPEHIRDLAEKFKPWTLYRLKETGHRVTIYSICENRTLTVCVLGAFNKIKFERRVFDVPPEDLEECDLPAADEEVGAELTDPADVEAYLAEVRAA